MQGFAITRSFRRPCGVNQLAQGVWVVADLPGNKKPPRSTEIVTYQAAPTALSTSILENGIGKHFVCAFVDDPAEGPDVVTRHKSNGYRLMRREPLFVVPTAESVRASVTDTRRVFSKLDADAVAKAARSSQIPATCLTSEDAICRLYAAYVDERPVGWVRSIRTGDCCAYVSNLYVSPEHRRRGIGRSLMGTMLEDDARFGVKWSVLLASQTGALLYPLLGYKQQGLLILFGSPRG